MITEQEGSIWIWLDTDTEVAYPTGNIATRAASKTATAGSSCVINAAKTVIDRIQMGPTGTAGTLSFFQHDGTTLIREHNMATPSGTNLATGVVAAGFVIYGPWSVSSNSTGATDIYIDFHYSNKWTS